VLTLDKLAKTPEDAFDQEDQQRDKAAQVFQREGVIPPVGPIGQAMVIPRTVGPTQGPMAMPTPGGSAAENLNQAPFPAAGPSRVSIAGAARNAVPTPNATAPTRPAMATPSGATAPAMPPPTSDSALDAISMVSPSRPIEIPPPAMKSATETLWDKARNVQNPFAKLLAETGAGLLRGADAAAESILPGPAMLMPGSILGTAARNNQAQNRFEKQQAIDTERENADTAKQRANTEAMQSPSTIARNAAETRNFESETNARNTPQQKTGLTPDEETFNDLMHGDHGAPRINPDTQKPYTTIEANRAVKQLSNEGKRFTDPFEAYAYGTPAEKKAARDFITFDKQTTAHNEKPSEISERYALYKRDPQAYMDMYGSHNSAQDSRDQAQASRMLKYFGDQRKAIEQNYTLDDDEKQKQLEQIDELEQPYLDIAQPQQNAQQGAPKSGPRGGRGNAPQYRVGDTVTYKGQQMRVLGVRKDGKLELQPIAGSVR